MLNTPVPSTNQEAIESQQDKSNQEQTERENVECTRDETEACPSPDPDTYSLPYGTFRRYNSLRIRKDASVRMRNCISFCRSMFPAVN